MGRDKALVLIDGVPLARRVADALEAGGCARVLAVGGDAPALAALGLEPVPDRWPGEGPLGGLATALGAVTGAAAAGEVLVLAPCDLLHPSPAAVAMLLAALEGFASGSGSGSGSGSAEFDAVAVRVGDRVQWLPSAWRVTPARAAAVAALVDGGARRLDAVAELVGSGAATVDLAPAEVADADTPADLP
jgi:molybdopterin-guanine dinucleotide biosynthesis protein A